MKVYLDLMQNILDNGVQKGDRTGTDTISLFGTQMRFDLAEGFPLLTTKRMHLKSVIYELLFFMQGRTDNDWLNKHGVSIWDEWADDNGELGPIYGHNWRHFGARPKAIPQPKPQISDGVEATYCGVANGSGSSTHPIGKVWQGMIQRCYAKNDIGYSHYGGRGVHVCNRWLQFTNFAIDYSGILGWGSDSYARLVLDKDGIGDGFCYSPETCQWVTDSHNSLLQSNKVYTVEKNGQQYSFVNASIFCKEQNISNHNFSDLWTGRKNAQVRHGFRLVSVEDRFQGYDQLAECLHKIKTNPNDRRMIVSAWHPYWLKYSALPPCHVLFQFYVANDTGRDRLSCQMYQRSCDFFLGVPFNIASYALLTMMMARMAGLGFGEFVWVGGDTHLYLNHLEQAEKQLQREPRELPDLLTNYRGQGLNDWQYEDFELIKYDPHPGIKAEISV